MSNDIGARSVPVFGGYAGEFRHVDEARWRRVAKNGVEQIYESQFEAECMAWRALKAKFFSLIRGDGERATFARSEAEKLFGAVFIKGKQIKVERA